MLDGQSVVREMRTVEGTAAPYATYLEGPSGPLYRRDDTSGGVRWYVFDGLGSVVAEVDPNGNVTSTRKYDVYGAVRTTTGTPTGKHGFVGQLGHTTEDETGLTYMRARYYDPAVGRFISEDPGMSGGNWLGYCEGNPVDRLDATGRAGVDVGDVDLLWQMLTQIGIPLPPEPHGLSVALGVAERVAFAVAMVSLFLPACGLAAALISTAPLLAIGMTIVAGAMIVLAVVAIVCAIKCIDDC